MDLLVNSYSSPTHNLAFEELFFERFENDTLRLWINPSSVIVGKHQCALAEADFRFCESEHIPILRRISGGGTVFHDSGNINFSFFRNLDQDLNIDYARNLEIISSVLNELGYSVVVNERYDIYHGDSKVSGNAQHIKRRKALHHGTILYDADRDVLRKAIAKPTASYESKAVQSVRSKVSNLRSAMDLGSTEEFLEKIIGKLVSSGMNKIEAPDFSSEIRGLEIERYSNPDWNIGYGPKYSFSKTYEDLEVHLEVARGGQIESASILKNARHLEVIEEALTGRMHYPTSIASYISSLEDYVEDQKSQLLNALY